MHTLPGLVLNEFDSLGIFIVDKGHMMRTGCNIYAAVQLLSRLAHLKLDLIYVGHAIGIAGCLGVHVDEFEKELIHNLDRARCLEAAELGPHEVVASDLDVATACTHEAHIEGIKCIKEMYDDCIIRHMHASKNEHGESLLGLAGDSVC
ncbi:hypothetical protein SCP_0202250 [Sparassis crispa]|uniref:Uncharacterized protein n=1 Tax=Sparassis crispa TaxID=139825 RepID=A0A401GA36_9APHY|nr:hypothetical protein SCP_0202250 [Sparassis crispa]GBE79028.1 hypothetical protein SCP_0202250 [Sparassis crispa]